MSVSILGERVNIPLKPFVKYLKLSATIIPVKIICIIADVIGSMLSEYI